MSEIDWTPLQTDICMSVARVAELVRLCLITKADAADTLHEAAIYNQLYFEYGADHIQGIMARAIEGAA
jgi:hypothetical protein